jgi:RNA polymerase sigma-70 factor, ECF subfamily
MSDKISVMSRIDANVREDARLLSGCPEDFGRFYERHEDFVLGLFLKRGLRSELTADLTAETFARALAGRARFDPARGEARGWLTGIARNVLAESARRGRAEDRARRRLQIERLQLDDAAIERIDRLAAELASRALEELPEDQREAVKARVLHDADYDTLARRMRCSQSVLRKRVSRGLATLRERLQEGA